MASSVVPQIETEDVVSPPEKKTSGGEDIGGIGASFPSVKQDDQTPRRPHRLPGVIAQKTPAVAGIHDDLPRGVGHLVFSRGPESQTAEDRLQVGASGPQGGKKRFVPCSLPWRMHKSPVLRPGFCIHWWRCRESNPGHYGYEPYALTG